MPVTLWNIKYFPEGDSRKDTKLKWFFLPNKHTEIGVTYNAENPDIKKIDEWLVKYGFKKEEIQTKLWTTIPKESIDSATSVVV